MNALVEMSGFTAVQAKYRHHQGKNVDSFESLDGESPISVSTNDVALYTGQNGKLRMIHADQHGIYSPQQTIQSFDDLVFILRYKRKHYVVNTEGFEYSRYCWPCELV
jgi:hypothetical protein